MGGDRCSRLKGVREWLPWRVAAVPDLTLGQLQEELRIHGTRVGRIMALRRFLEKSIIETGNEQEVRRKVYHAKSVPLCSDGRCRLAGFRAVRKQGAKAASLQPSSYGPWRPQTL